MPPPSPGSAGPPLHFAITPCVPLLWFIWLSHGAGALLVLFTPSPWAWPLAPLLLLLAVGQHQRHRLQGQLLLKWGAGAAQISLKHQPAAAAPASVQLASYGWVLLRVRLGPEQWRQLLAPPWARPLLWPRRGALTLVLCRCSSEPEAWRQLQQCLRGGA